MSCCSRVRKISASFTFEDRDDWILGDASGGDIVVQLKDATTRRGKRLILGKEDGSGNSVSFKAYGSQTINGQSELELSDRYASVAIESDGANWFVVYDFQSGAGTFQKIVLAGIDAKDESATEIWTATFDGEVLAAVVRCVQATSVSMACVAGIGIAAGEEDICGQQLLAGLISAGKSYSMPCVMLKKSFKNGDIVKFGISEAAVGTSQELEVDLLVYRT